MSSLKEFIAAVKTEGMARTNKFAVEFALPLALAGSPGSYYSSKLQTILLYCDRASLPGLNLATSANRSFGEVREVPYEKLFENIELSFYVDNSLVVKSLFDSWMGVIQDPYTRTYSYYKDYISNIRVIVFDSKSNTRYQVELFEAFPKTVSSIQLDYNGKEVMKLNVTFVYKYAEKTDFASPQSDKYSNNLFNISNELKGLEIPDGYFTDFAGFQNTYTKYNESFENARTALFNETQNFATGTGERISVATDTIRSKLGTIIG